MEELAQEREAREVLESRTKAQAQINSNLQNSLEMVKEQKALAEGLAEQRGQEVRCVYGTVRTADDVTGRWSG